MGVGGLGPGSSLHSGSRWCEEGLESGRRVKGRRCGQVWEVAPLAPRRCPWRQEARELVWALLPRTPLELPLAGP